MKIVYYMAKFLARRHLLGFEDFAIVLEIIIIIKKEQIAVLFCNFVKQRVSR